LRERAKAGEDRKHDDRPGEHAHAPETIRQHPETDAADHGADQRRRHKRCTLGRRQPKIARDRPQHEAEDQKIKPVHGVAERGAEQRFPRIAVHGGRHAL
jgi:hypothetical protein